MKKLYLVFVFLIVAGCVNLPDGIAPVKEFELERYSGKWYEIARLDHWFERGLTDITAEQSLADDGSVKVVNRGFDPENDKWKRAVGKAFFVNAENEGFLKVSFWGPFYGSYVVFDLDRENYQYSFVCGPDRSYLWLLSRTPTVKEDVIEAFIQKSEALGFDKEKIIFVDHK